MEEQIEPLTTRLLKVDELAVLCHACMASEGRMHHVLIGEILCNRSRCSNLLGQSAARARARV